jgi:uncharacterized damage-inducible protein DinB
MASPPDTRPEPPYVGGERDTLVGFLDYQRATLLWKCADIGPGDLVRRAVPTSNLSLIGIVRHMTLVEWSWFEERFSGLSVPPPISMDEDVDADFNDLDPARADADFARFDAQCDISRRLTAAGELDQLAEAARNPLTLRWILVHMIEEYARHNGHADLLREAIDGAVGE